MMIRWVVLTRKSAHTTLMRTHTTFSNDSGTQFSFLIAIVNLLCTCVFLSAHIMHIFVCNKLQFYMCVLRFNYDAPYPDRDF